MATMEWVLCFNTLQLFGLSGYIASVEAEANYYP